MMNRQTGNEARRIEPVIGGHTAHAADADRPLARHGSRRNGKWIVVAALLVVVIAGAGVLWYREHSSPPPAPVAVAPPPAAPAKIEPAIRHPIGPAATEAPLPPLARSDVVVFDALAALVGKDLVGRFIVLPDIVKRVVVAVDNLPRETLAQRLSPVKPVPGAFVVAKGGGGQVIGAANAARYTLYVRAFDAVDAASLVAVYARFYPLFQEAYRELGYPKGYFNDRLVETLDLMIAAPEPAGPIALVQEKVMYEFADPKLESLPVGQKMLLRMGPENARKVKAKLREIRALVATRN
jgi:hypothetical protein